MSIIPKNSLLVNNSRVFSINWGLYLPNGLRGDNVYWEYSDRTYRGEQKKFFIQQGGTVGDINDFTIFVSLNKNLLLCNCPRYGEIGIRNIHTDCNFDNYIVFNTNGIHVEVIKRFL